MEAIAPDVILDDVVAGVSYTIKPVLVPVEAMELNEAMELDKGTEEAVVVVPDMPVPDLLELTEGDTDPGLLLDIVVAAIVVEMGEIVVPVSEGASTGPRPP